MKGTMNASNNRGTRTEGERAGEQTIMPPASPLPIESSDSASGEDSGLEGLVDE